MTNGDAEQPNPLSEPIGAQPAVLVSFDPMTQFGGLPMQAVVQQQVQVWQGQFPPPEAIERYEAVTPGTFDRLLRMAERQQEASIEALAEARQFQKGDTSRGQWLGFSATIGAIGGAVVCAYLKQPIVAGLLVGVPVLSVAKALVDSWRPQQPVAVQIPAPKPDGSPDES